MAEAQQIKNLEQDKSRSERDVERTKTILKTSEASKDLCDYVVSGQKKDPFVNSSVDSPYTKKPTSASGCALF